MALPEILRGILARRGVVTDEEVEAFLNPALGELAKPDELPGVTGAAMAILSAVKRGREIVIFGDYDCDGICATAIMVKTLRALKANVSPFVPERLGEGYGMSEAAIRRMLREHPRAGMIITVDNGINSVDRVNWLRWKKDIEMVVTDHHLPGNTLPNCLIVNPKVLAPPHLRQLCGAAVAFFIANAIVDLARAEGVYAGGKIGGELLVLAGIATITDIMPLMGQNRILVTEALKRFMRLAPLGLRELYERAARTVQPVLTAKDFGFLIGPRINAAGRIASGLESLELILAEDREQARAAALRVDGRNVERKSLEQAMVDEANAKIVKGAPAQVIDLSGGHQGVSGIVAARMLERQEGAKVPVCVIVDGRGSARAPDGYNVRDAFVAASETLEDYGGHAAAGGFTVKPGRMEDFRRLFGEACAAQRATLAATGALNEADVADAVVEPDDLTLAFAEALRTLEPFGEGNAEPVFRICNATLTEVRQVGADGRHLSLTVKKGYDRLRAVWWGEGDKVEEYRAGAGIAFDVDFRIEISDYQERHVELRIVRLVPVQ